MTCNRELAKQREIPEEDVDCIDVLHEMADYVMKQGCNGVYTDEFVKDYLEKIEYELQYCWRFPADPLYHTYYKNYLIKKQFANRKFKCTETGEELTIPWEVKETDCFYFGKCMLDVGRLGFYSRASGHFVGIIKEEKE